MDKILPTAAAPPDTIIEITNHQAAAAAALRVAFAWMTALRSS